MTGELTRVRFRPGGLQDGRSRGWWSLPGPVRACCEAGADRVRVYRAAIAAGVEMQVVAPGKTPRGPSDRVKTDPKDSELLARCLMAGSPEPIHGPVPEVRPPASWSAPMTLSGGIR